MEELGTDSDEKIVNQLREKIRTQAQRLRQLEQYRVLCEQFIVSLSPNVKLPVTLDDIQLNTVQAASDELGQAKQTIERLEQELSSQRIEVPLAHDYKFPHPSTDLTLQQLKELYSAIYFQHYHIIKDKKTLEESLRAEIQVSEEQKYYIEALKHTLENSGRLSIGDLPSNSLDTPLKYSDYDNTDRQTIENHQILLEKNKTDAFLQEAADALQLAEEEVQKLEQENKSLISDNEKLKNKEKNFVENIEKLNHTVNKLKNENTGLIGNLETLRDTENKLVQEINELKYDLDNLCQENQHLKANLQKTQEKNLKIQNQLSDFKEKASKDEVLMQLSVNNSKKALEKQIKTLTELNQTLETQNSELQTAEVQIVKERDKLKSILETKNSEMQKYENKMIKKKQKNLELENSFAEYKKKISELELKLEKSENVLQTTQTTVIKLKKKIKSVQETIQLKSQRLETAEAEIIKCKNDWAAIAGNNEKTQKKLSEEVYKLKNTIEKDQKIKISLQDELDKNIENLEKITQIKQKLEQDLEKSEKNLNIEKSSHILLQDENSLLKNKTADLENQINFIKKLSTSKESELQNFLKDQENKINWISSDLVLESKEKSRLAEENRQLFEDLSILSDYKSESLQTKAIISRFCNNFGAVCEKSLSYKEILSKNFIDQIYASNTLDRLSTPNWTAAICLEIESILRTLVETKQDITIISQKLQSKQTKMDALCQTIKSLSENQRKSENELETAYKEKTKILNEKEIIENKLQLSYKELNCIKSEINLCKENYLQSTQDLNKANHVIDNLKKTLDVQMTAIKKNEIENFNLIEDKKIMTKVLIRLESLLSAEDLNSTYLDILKINPSELGNSFQADRPSRVRAERDGRSVSYDFSKTNYEF